MARVVQLARDPGRRARMGDAARVYVRNFGLRSALAAMRDIYVEAEILADRRASRRGKA